MEQLDRIAARDDGMGLEHNVLNRLLLRERNSEIVAEQIKLSIDWDRLTHGTDASKLSIFDI